MYALLLATVLCGQGTPPQAPPLELPDQAPPLVDDTPKPKVEPPQPKESPYMVARRKCLDTGQTLVVFVRCEARIIDGTKNGVVSVGVDKLEGYDMACIVIAMPHPDGEMRLKATLPPGSPDDAIRRAIGPEGKVEPMAPPFGLDPLKPFAKQRPERPGTADDNLQVAGPWPKGLEKPEGLVRYKRTMFTQRIFNGTITEKVSRFGLGIDPKWHQSGGMAGIKDFRSDLYKSLPGPVKEWLGPIHVKTSFPAGQFERGWLREFPEGSVFMDVLSKDGIVFEARERKKVKGQFQSRVVYTDASARPAGYHGLKQTCSSCHDAPDASYAVGLTPGGGGVISLPIVGLERLMEAIYQ